MAEPKNLLTITQLAQQTGLSSRTIRFWSDAGVIPVARRSAAGYRLYDHAAVARLELVRTLRELGLGLSAITEILRKQRTLTQAAATHVAAIDARLRELRLQRAVLRVVVRRGADAKETRAMKELLQASAAERRRIVDDFVQRAFADIDDSAPGAMIAQAMRSLPPELPEEPSDAHVEAWLELTSLLGDAGFAARVREMALAGAAAQHPQPVDVAAIREHAQRALDAGVAPESEAATAVIDRIVGSASSEERRRMRRQLEAFNDVRVERYWQLMAVLNDRPGFPPVAAAVDWFIAGLRARE